MARIEQAELARRSQLSLETIKRLERIRGTVEANSRTIAAITEAFEGLGVYFDQSDDGAVGVRRSPHPPQIASRMVRPGGIAVTLHRLIYYSTATPAVAGQMKPLVESIVAGSEAPNRALGITGALFACDGRFLHALEGPKEAVRQVYGGISSDVRHTGLTVLENRRVVARQFADWSICCGLFDSDDPVLAQEPALRNGFHPDVLSPSAALGLLSVVRDLQASPPRSERGYGEECPLAGICLDRVCADGAGGSPERQPGNA
ncbi:BLUF domain-containing protein [Phenylobacterium sp.]|uniref:BLUF domain-containing protein n=1 Tax=Phenylobacterium sp. TaxID=1871053 RepID=UPI003BAB4133